MELKTLQKSPQEVHLTTQRALLNRTEFFTGNNWRIVVGLQSAQNDSRKNCSGFVKYNFKKLLMRLSRIPFKMLGTIRKNFNNKFYGTFVFPQIVPLDIQKAVFSELLHVFCRFSRKLLQTIRRKLKIIFSNLIFVLKLLL